MGEVARFRLVDGDENPHLAQQLAEWEALCRPVEIASEFNPEKPLIVQALNILGEYIEEVRQPDNQQSA